MRRAAASLALLALTGCGGESATRVPPPEGVASFVALVSDAGDPLAGGTPYAYSKANALITVRPFGAQVAMRVVGDRVWDGYLALSSSDTQLRAGAFADLTNAPSAGAAGFRWSSQALTCAASVATVTIDSVRYDGAALSALDLRFEQRCDGKSAALRGQVHWRAADEPNAFAPVLPIPTALWRAPAGATPASGPYVYLDGDADLIPGITLPQTIVPAPAAMRVRASANQLSIVAADPATAVTMTGSFQEMIGQTAMLEGYYRDLRAASERSTLGGIDVGVNTWDCASLVGWFVIDHQFYFQGNLTIIDLRFEVRCGGFGAPLRGQLHWAESGA